MSTRPFDQLEPACKQINHKAEASEVFLFSIAISMKRIADELAGTEKTSGLVGAIYDVVHQGRQT